MSERDVKDRILKTAIALLEEMDDPSKITIRLIADRAQVGIGLINYHFQTKDNLLYLATGEYMAQMALTYQIADRIGQNPKERLKSMLKSLSDFAIRYPKQMRIGAMYQLQNGDFGAAFNLLPVLREICGDKKEEAQIRILAFQIQVSTNIIFLRQDEFLRFSGLDMNVKEQRDRILDILVDNIVEQ